MACREFELHVLGKTTIDAWQSWIVWRLGKLPVVNIWNARPSCIWRNLCERNTPVA